MTNDFDGIREKLKRADESIRNLKTEIDAFIQNGEYPTIPDHKDNAWQKAVDYHRDKIIPLRFAVLVGEIAHQLRSSLDHIVWLFSDESTRLNHSTAIEFPIFESRPRDKDELRRYKRKIQGIASLSIKRFIEALQPYHAGTDAAYQPLSIIHNMDRFDKHRELTIVDSGVNIIFTIPPHVTDYTEAIMKHKEGKVMSLRDRGMMGRAIKKYGNVSPDIAFRQFGKRGSQLVVPVLTQLSEHVRLLIDKFELMHGGV
jgi:hypothetical protein